MKKRYENYPETTGIRPSVESVARFFDLLFPFDGHHEFQVQVIIHPRFAEIEITEYCLMATMVAKCNSSDLLAYLAENESYDLIARFESLMRDARYKVRTHRWVVDSHGYKTRVVNYSQEHFIDIIVGGATYIDKVQETTNETKGE